MEEAGARVESPVVIHQTLTQRFCNTTHPTLMKRGLNCHSLSIPPQNPSPDDWNPKSWEWDSARFVAKPVQTDGARDGNPTRADHTGKNDGSLRFNLGDAGFSLEEGPQQQPLLRPNKRVRSGLPGGVNHPLCQVDDCEKDLISAKDYHRRHKVCEVHSKASKAMVGKQMQRFCQQCSRFHPLSEFDEGKRSCRRRLAGHNRRRRKIQVEETTPRVLVPGSPQKNIDCDVNVINLLTVLAHAQGNTDQSGKSSLPSEKENLLQILGKINSLSLPANLASKLPLPRISSSSVLNHTSPENQNQTTGDPSCPSTMDLLAALSSETESQPTSESSASEKSRSVYVDQVNLARGERITGYHSPIEERNGHHVRDTSPSLQLQLFSSSLKDTSSRKLPLGGNCILTDSSNPSEERSPASSPPLMHDLFPLQTSRETANACLSNSKGDLACEKSRTSNGFSTSLQLFGGSIQVNENGSMQCSSCRADYASPSGSEHSPSSPNSDSQDRTGRIVFKLFNKDPSQLPGSLRNQIFNWLSTSPSEMESYIRPGCIVLSLYLSMSSFAWNQLEVNFLSYVESLVKDTDVGFWGNGRFLVYTDRKIASHEDGKTRLCKSWRAWTIPKLISVTPVAVVAGQATSLLLRGTSLTAPGTTIHCTHADGYNIEKVASWYQAAGQDEIRLNGFEICEAKSNMPGRCFIEVGNGVRSTTFPVIIADNTICHELRLLEPEINGVSAGIRENNNDVQNSARLWSRQEIMHFLEELGWLFQRKSNSSLFVLPSYRLARFKYLLVFSVEHDFCALVKTLLDFLLELNLGVKDLSLTTESFTMLSEIHLLNRAVRRRCGAMVDLLVNYSVLDSDALSRKFIYPPDLAGPNSLTPLHLAACASSAADIVDALTNDPQAIGLRFWNSVLDADGLSPYAYASMRNNHSYNDLVAHKLAHSKHRQISISIPDEIRPIKVEPTADRNAVDSHGPGPRGPCLRCTAVYGQRFPSPNGLLRWPFFHSVLVIAAVCVCVCVLLRGGPCLGSNGLCNPSSLVWEKLRFGSS